MHSKSSKISCVFFQLLLFLHLLKSILLMKYIYGLLILFYGLNISAQQTHIITGNDHYFSPDTAYVDIGDTVRLVSLGYHSITELDSIDWVNNQFANNGGFWVGLGGLYDWFVVSQPGKYYFNCNPHADMGMKGVLYVGSALGNKEETHLDGFKAYLDKSNRLHLDYTNVKSVNIYSITGKIVYTKQLEFNSNSKVVELNFEKGIYLVSFLNENSIRATKKIIIK